MLVKAFPLVLSGKLTPPTAAVVVTRAGVWAASQVLRLDDTVIVPAPVPVTGGMAEYMVRFNPEPPTEPAPGANVPPAKLIGPEPTP